MLTIHLVITALMTGLVLFVGVVHYPLFSQVGREDFCRYEQLHAARTTWIVAPLMLAEVGSGLIAWFGGFVPASATMLFSIAAALLVVAWLVTFLINVPQHAKLGKGFEARVHRSLCQTHWIRTFAWIGRVVLLSVVVVGNR